jgi:hypothetical protein
MVHNTHAATVLQEEKMMFNVEFYDADGSLAHNANVASLDELEELACGRLIKITGRSAIDTSHAILVIDAYRQGHGLTGTLEAMLAMKIDRNLTHHQRHAFEHVFAGMRKLFHGDDA